MSNKRVLRQRVNESTVDKALRDIYDELDKLQPIVNPYTDNQEPLDGQPAVVETSDGTLASAVYMNNEWLVDINSNYQRIGTPGFISSLGSTGRSRVPIKNESVKYDDKNNIAIIGSNKSKVLLKNTEGMLNVRNADDTDDATLVVKKLHLNTGAASGSDKEFKISYDDNNYTTFTVDSDGDLKIAVTDGGSNDGNIFFNGITMSYDGQNNKYLACGTTDLGGDGMKLYVTGGEAKAGTANKRGGQLLLQCGQSTGEADAGHIIFQMSNVGVEDATTQNSYSTVAYFSGTIATRGQLQLNYTLNANDIECDDITSSGSLIVDKDIDNTTAATNAPGLHIDYDRVGAVVSGMDLNTGLDIDMNVTGAGTSGTPLVQAQGANITIVGDNAGSGGSVNYGLWIDVSGADANNGIYIDNDDGDGHDFKNVSSANANDSFTINTVAEGATTLATNDYGSTVAHLTLDVDGDIILDSESGITKFYRAGDTDDYCKLSVIGSGQTRLSSFDSDGTAAHIILDASGDVHLDAESGQVAIIGGTLKISEQADANADTAGYGQIWVDTATPNELAFTDDAGTDIIGIGKYHYDVKVANFYGTATGNYLPLAGYIVERTSTANNNEYLGLLAPFTGTLERVMWRSEIAQSGSTSLRILEASDGTEIPGTTVYRKDYTLGATADDTTITVDMTSPGTGTYPPTLTKGKLYFIYLVSPSNPLDTNVSLVFKWDITS